MLKQVQYDTCSLAPKGEGEGFLIRDSETVLDYWQFGRLNAVLTGTCWVHSVHTAHLPKSAVRNDCYVFTTHGNIYPKP